MEQQGGRTTHPSYDEADARIQDAVFGVGEAADQLRHGAVSPSGSNTSRGGPTDANWAVFVKAQANAQEANARLQVELNAKTQEKTERRVMKMMQDTRDQFTQQLNQQEKQNRIAAAAAGAKKPSELSECTADAFRSWRRQFEIACSRRNWKHKVARLEAIAALTGKAAVRCRAIEPGAETINPHAPDDQQDAAPIEDLLDEMEELFIPPEEGSVAMESFHGASQKQGESATDWCTHVTLLYRKAFPLNTAAQVNVNPFLVRKFVHGLVDGRILEKLTNQKIDMRTMRLRASQAEAAIHYLDAALQNRTADQKKAWIPGPSGSSPSSSSARKGSINAITLKMAEGELLVSSPQGTCAFCHSESHFVWNCPHMLTSKTWFMSAKKTTWKKPSGGGGTSSRGGRGAGRGGRGKARATRTGAINAIMRKDNGATYKADQETEGQESNMDSSGNE